MEDLDEYWFPPTTIKCKMQVIIFDAKKCFQIHQAYQQQLLIQHLRSQILYLLLSFQIFEDDMKINHVEKAREDRVIQHIQTFKVLKSHYIFIIITLFTQFLPKELAISEMHRLYIKWCDNKCFPKENFDFYKRVFTRRFNLKFQQLKKDEYNKLPPIMLQLMSLMPNEKSTKSIQKTKKQREE